MSIVRFNDRRLAASAAMLSISRGLVADAPGKRPEQLAKLPRHRRGTRRLVMTRDIGGQRVRTSLVGRL
jgi:hypothetical protein